MIHAQQQRSFTMNHEIHNDPVQLWPKMAVDGGRLWLPTPQSHNDDDTQCVQNQNRTLQVISDICLQ